MNLTEFYEAQAELDKKIVKEKGLQGQRLLDKKILALQVELGELANELPEEFKFWGNKKNDYEKALEEFVDAFHLTLSIGLDLEYELSHVIAITRDNTITEQLLSTNWMVTKFEESKFESDYELMFGYLLGLGKLLGFTNEQIKDAYYEKNEVNHIRQATNY